MLVLRMWLWWVYTRCEVQVAYAIGRSHPVGLYTECFGTETVPVEQINDAVSRVFDLRPAALIADLQLLRPIYSQVTTTATSDASSM